MITRAFAIVNYVHCARGNSFVKIQLMILSLLSCVFLSACDSSSKKQSGTEDSGIPCGGMGNFTCPATMYCKLKKNCGGMDGVGSCVKRPFRCEPENKPVCGCDGKDHPSPCLAAASGISVLHEGKCEE